ncbi:hypothetical protein CROQUDRAFT_92393 [Cronartium quercuum f. sp. fusiforme G11]|uniref:Uncharacterized protein n=1 Tax=Cronartium quercuum f. sp. fusiforme G11 TaxID=708437 RepID=A0A9P6TCG2_9BASI|nr:hypothetical protein CROQUDRAFT_92393 [Cronartium quercuum f. sp. fusiforme G11]
MNRIDDGCKVILVSPETSLTPREALWWTAGQCEGNFRPVGPACRMVETNYRYTGFVKWIHIPCRPRLRTISDDPGEGCMEFSEKFRERQSFGSISTAIGIYSVKFVFV